MKFCLLVWVTDLVKLSLIIVIHSYIHVILGYFFVNDVIMMLQVVRETIIMFAIKVAPESSKLILSIIYLNNS